MGRVRFDPRQLTRLGRLIVYLLAALFTALLYLLSGCAFSYGKETGYKGVVGCVNLTGPGFSLACPEGELKAPTIPNNVPQPSLEPAR